MLSVKKILNQKFASLPHQKQPLRMLIVGIIVVMAGIAFYYYLVSQHNLTQLDTTNAQLLQEKADLQKTQEELQAQIDILENEDTRKRNNELSAQMAEIEKSFAQTNAVYEQLVDARLQGVSTAEADKDYAAILDLLAKKNYADATTKNIALGKKLTDLLSAKQVQVALTQAAPVAADLPSSGSYRRQTVKTGRGDFAVSLIAEEASSVKVITDTANDDTCTSNCAALPLATYVSRNGGFAGINGSYFCPPDYPTCADKVNSFNTLVFNARLKKYMNSDQNVYSTNPMVVQNADHSFRFMGQSLEWGRDTGIIGGIANYPMLVSGGQARVTDTGGKGPRGFIGVKGGTVYIGVVSAADLGDAAAVLAALGLDTALNLDGGGSSALYYNGKYVVGPGRNLPNAVILAR